MHGCWKKKKEILFLFQDNMQKLFMHNHNALSIKRNENHVLMTFNFTVLSVCIVASTSYDNVLNRKNERRERKRDRERETFSFNRPNNKHITMATVRKIHTQVAGTTLLFFHKSCTYYITDFKVATKSIGCIGWSLDRSIDFNNDFIENKVHWCWIVDKARGHIQCILYNIECFEPIQFNAREQNQSGLT